jgi:hypothetical protein
MNATKRTSDFKCCGDSVKWNAIAVFYLYCVCFKLFYGWELKICRVVQQSKQMVRPIFA